jgi:DNA-binding NarL/FixJ family response regulator
MMRERTGSGGVEISVVVADCTALTGQLISLALRRDRHLLVTELSSHGVLESVPSLQPDVVLLSYHMEGNAGGGFEILKELRTVVPQSRVIMLLDTEDRSAIVNSFRTGARGVFCRNYPLKMLTRCVRRVHEGQFWVSGSQLEFVVQALASAPSTPVVDARGIKLLSPREQEVVHWMSEGLGNRAIAGKMQLSENTVKNYVFRIFEKLGVSNRVEVVRYAAAQHAARPKKPSDGGANSAAAD